MLSAILIAQSAVGATPKVGESAPDFSLSTMAGKSIRLSDATSKGPVVLVLLRGYPGYQCPYCNRQVQEFIRRSADFSGSQVIFVYPGPMVRAREFATDKSMPSHFEMALDPDFKFTEMYGLRWNAPDETSYPSTFVIDAKGKVVFAKVSNSHGGRASASEVIEHLKKR